MKGGFPGWLQCREWGSLLTSPKLHPHACPGASPTWMFCTGFSLFPRLCEDMFLSWIWYLCNMLVWKPCTLKPCSCAQSGCAMGSSNENFFPVHASVPAAQLQTTICKKGEKLGFKQQLQNVGYSQCQDVGNHGNGFSVLKKKREREEKKRVCMEFQ